MSRYVGLNVHKQFIEVCILDAAGRVLWRGRTGCSREELERFARTRLKKTDRVALEATTNTWAVVTLLRPHVAAVVCKLRVLGAASPVACLPDATKERGPWEKSMTSRTSPSST